jgi:glyoxylase-like metal-dependent hydrolase (beta-lactamase superfamily II)/rhodanese-related sulfurtransferase
MHTPILKALRSEGCCSYLIGCPETRKALLIDPKAGQEALVRYYLDCYGLDLIGVLDTHTHADHLSASTRFAGPELPLWMSHRTQVRRAHYSLEHGQDLKVGELRFKTLEVPGHTPDSISLLGHGSVFTGDSLFIDGLARTDFRGSDSSQLFESVRSELMTLPDCTLVFPGHDYGDHLFSTIGCEAQRNPALAFSNAAVYANSLHSFEGAGNSPAVEDNIALNLEEDPTLPTSPAVVAACCASPGPISMDEGISELAPTQCEEAHCKIQSPEDWIDVRDPHEWRHGRIPNTCSIPLSELGFHLEALRGRDSLYLSCRTGVRSITAAKTLQRLGITRNPISIQGGIIGWQEQNLPIEGLPAK